MGLTLSKTASPPPHPETSTTETQQLIALLQKSLADLSSSLSEPGRSADRHRSFAAIQAGFGALEAAILPSEVFVCAMAMEFHVAAALGLAVEHGFAEIVSSASSGDQGGASSELIEERTGMPSGKVSRIMRLLCGRSIFQEIRPDVWAHSRHSLTLDSGKGYEYIVKNPVGRYTLPEAKVASWVYNTSVFGLKASAGFFPAYRDDKLLKSYKPNQTPFNVAYKTDGFYWEWLEQPGGFGAQTFMNAMSCGKRQSDFSRYPWHELGPDALLVDVGGGNGSTAALIIPHAKNIARIVIQDRPTIVDSGKAIWNAVDKPVALGVGQTVDFQVHDFFESNPVRGAHAYFMRLISHDWPDEDLVVILSHLHDASAGYSRLLIMDSVVSHACHDLGDAVSSAVPGAYPAPLPAPLPANGGRAVEFELTMDMHMMCVLNGQERTHLKLKEVAARAGWKASRVYDLDASSFKITEFAPVPKGHSLT